MSEVSMCDSLAFLQHICRWTFSRPPVVVGRDDGDELGGVIGPDEGLHRLLDELLLLHHPELSPRSASASSVARSMDEM